MYELEYKRNGEARSLETDDIKAACEVGAVLHKINMIDPGRFDDVYINFIIGGEKLSINEFLEEHDKNVK